MKEQSRLNVAYIDNRRVLSLFKHFSILYVFILIGIIIISRFEQNCNLYIICGSGKLYTLLAAEINF